MSRSAGTGLRCLLFVALFMTVVSFCACETAYPQKTSEASSSAEKERGKVTGFISTGIDSYDSADTAIFMGKDAEKGTITLWNLAVCRTYTLSYDGTTLFSDKYGESMSLAQFTPGDIVDVTFLKSGKHLTTLKLASDTWSYEKVNAFELDPVRGEACVGQEGKKLKITANTQFFSDGATIDMMEINSVDVLSFQGIDSELLSVTVDKGHGYLRLSGQEKFVGGWLEVGQNQIQRVAEDMLLAVTEGTYRVTISKDGNSGEKVAVIRRNEETLLDVSDLQVAEPEMGTILFSLSPSSAKLFIDGEKADPTLPVTLVYGIHQLMVKADGYQTLTQYVRVGQPSAGLDITLDPVSEGEEETSSGEDPADVATDYYKVYIDAPEGAEVYLDGNYVGICPCSFAKVPGTHSLILRKSGYTSKTYTVQIADEDKDISYSFAELESASVSSESTEGLNNIISDVIGTLLD